MTPVVARPPWTPDEDELLHQLALAGNYAATIAGQMKRSEFAIRKRAAKLNITLSKVQRSGLKAKDLRRMRFGLKAKGK